MALLTHTYQRSGLFGGSIISPNIDTTGAKSLFVFISTGAGGTTPSSITCSKGNTFVALTEQNISGYGCRIYHCLNPTSVGTGHNISTPGFGGYGNLYFAAFDDDLSVLDGQSGATNSSATTLAPGSVTPTVANCLFLTMLSINGPVGSVGSSFTVGNIQNPWVDNSGWAYKKQSGAPTAENPTWTFSASGTNAAVMAVFRLNVLTITTTSLAEGKVSNGYSQTIAITGGAGSKVFSVYSGSLPPGLTLNPSTGVISGVPTARGTYSFTIRVTDSVAAFDDQAFTVFVSDFVFSVTGGALVTADIGSATTTPAIDSTGAKLIVMSVSGISTQTVFDSKSNTWIPLTERADGSANKNRLYYCINPITGSGHTFTTFSSGSFPSIAVIGMSGDYVYVSESGASGSQPGSITTGGPNRYLFTSVTLDGLAGETPAIDSGFLIERTVPALPSNHVGISLAYKKTVKGGPHSENPTWSGLTAARPITMALFKPAPPVIGTTSLPGGQIGIGYVQPITITGGQGTRTLSVVSGTLPPGLVISDWSIIGIPTTGGVYTFTLRVTDEAADTDDQALSILVTAPVFDDFPSPDLTGIGWMHFEPIARDFSETTNVYTFEDGYQIRQEISLEPPRRWSIIYTGLTPAQVTIFETFYNSKRVVIPFMLRDKWAVEHEGVRIESYERSHSAHKSWSQTVSFVLVQYQ